MESRSKMAVMSDGRYKKSENGRTASPTPRVAVMTCGNESSAPLVQKSAKMSMRVMARGEQKRILFHTFKPGMLLKTNEA